MGNGKLVETLRQYVEVASDKMRALEAILSIEYGWAKGDKTEGKSGIGVDEMVAKALQGTDNCDRSGGNGIAMDNPVSAMQKPVSVGNASNVTEIKARVNPKSWVPPPPPGKKSAVKKCSKCRIQWS